MALEADEIDIDELMEASAWSPFQKMVLAAIALAFLVDGIANQSLGLAIPALMQDWSLSREAFAPMAALGLVGLTIGAVIGGVMGDRYGRRMTIIASTAFFGLATLAQAWVSGTTDLMILRFIDGLGIGAMIPNGAALLTEFTPRRKRPLALSIGMSFVAVGAMVSGLIGNLLIEPHGWQGLFIVCGGVSLAVAVLLLLFLPESPVYLTTKGGEQAELRQVLERCGMSIGARRVTSSGAKKTEQEHAPLRALFADGVGSSTIFLWIAFFFCLLANYAMFSWVPAMLASLGFALSLTGLGMTWLSLGGILGGITCGWLIGRFGSRKVVLVMAAGGALASSALGLFIAGGGAELVAILAFLFVIGVFASGLLNGVYTFSAFIYPDQARSTGVGAAAAAGRLGAIASSFAGVIALGLGGASGYFLLIGGSFGAAMIAVAFITRQIGGPAQQEVGD